MPRTTRAIRSPSAARRSTEARGAPTMANSAATNSALTSTSRVMITTATTLSTRRLLLPHPRPVHPPRRGQDGGHGVPVHRFDLHLHPVDAHPLARLRHVPQLFHHPSTHGVGLAFPQDPQPRLRLVY